MTAPQWTALAMVITAMIGACERLTTHFDLDCRASKVWGENEDLPERLLQ